MRTVRLQVKVTEPKRTRNGGISLGLSIVDPGGLKLGAGEGARMNMNFPIGPGDVGLVLPVDVAIYGKDEDPGEAPPAEVTDEYRQTLEDARAELARKRAAGEVPPISPQARALLAEMRRTLERGDTKATVSLGSDLGRSRASTTIKPR